MTDTCKELHIILSVLHRHNFKFENTNIPDNGIYVLFEKGEFAHSTDRIVRVGAHTGKNKLKSRLKEHFLIEKKDRSIFRKNIGRALLNKDNDNYLSIWDLDLTSVENKIKYKNVVDEDYQKDIESRVSRYIQDNFTFSIIEVSDKEERIKLESKLISTVSNCSRCRPSENWLGLCSTRAKIRESGLWQVNELYKESLNEKELCKLKKVLLQTFDTD